ncbi:hypothetical protein WA158_001043 [Blastocystis sp. Blastoise]
MKSYKDVNHDSSSSFDDSNYPPLLADNNVLDSNTIDIDTRIHRTRSESSLGPIPVVKESEMGKEKQGPSRPGSKGLIKRLRAMSTDRFKPVLIQLDELDPSPLGLFGTGMGFLYVGLWKLGATQGPILLFPWLILIPGILQLIAGWVDISRGNLFGALTFTAYGLFWLGLSATLMIEVYATPEVTTTRPDQQLGVAFAGYALYTVGLTLIALPINISFVLLLILIIAVCILADFEIWADMSVIAGAVLSCIIAVISFYIYFSLILRSILGRDILPLGPALLDTKTLKFKFIKFGHSYDEYMSKQS